MQQMGVFCMMIALRVIAFRWYFSTAYASNSTSALSLIFRIQEAEEEEKEAQRLEMLQIAAMNPDDFELIVPKSLQAAKPAQVRSLFFSNHLHAPCIEQG